MLGVLRDGIRKQAEIATGGEPVSSTPPWSLLQSCLQVSALSSFHGGVYS